MERAIQSHSVSEIKSILREYLCTNDRVKTTSRRKPSARWPLDNPRRAQAMALADEAHAEAQYESVIILLSGYSEKKMVRVERKIAKDLLNSLSALKLIHLPAEIRNTIYDYASPTGRIIGHNASGRPYIECSGLNEACRTSFHEVVPALLQTCSQIRQETIPPYFSKQTFAFESGLSAGMRDSHCRAQLGVWLRALKVGVGVMSLLEISIRSIGGHIVFKLDGKEYSAVARLEHENGDVGQMMLQIRLIVASVKGVVGEDVIEPSKHQPTVSIRWIRDSAAPYRGVECTANTAQVSVSTEIPEIVGRRAWVQHGTWDFGDGAVGGAAACCMQSGIDESVAAAARTV